MDASTTTITTNPALLTPSRQGALEVVGAFIIIIIITTI
jgi:hypothetical protein